MIVGTDRAAETFRRLELGPPRTTLLAVPRAGVRLAPVTWGDLDDAALLARLARWRAEHMAVYPTQFEVNVASTRTWLEELVLGVPNRLMLLAIAEDGGVAGHMGLADASTRTGSATISNVLAGRPKALPRGAMAAALEVMIGWAHGELGLGLLRVPVFANNAPALGFFRRARFVEAGRIPLRHHSLPGGRVEYRPRADDDPAPPDREWIELVRRLDGATT